MKVVSFLAVVMGSLIWGACNCVPAVNCQRDFNPATDSVYHVTIDGKDMAFPLVYSDSKYRIYLLETPFVEHDTTFLYREYSYYKCDTCTTYEKVVSSYYIVPRHSPDFRKHLRQALSFWDWDDNKYHDEMLAELKQGVPTLIHNDLGDMPRLWYNVVKYNGQYCLSADFYTVIELRDSVEVFHGMELGYSALRNVSKQGDTYRYETYYPSYEKGNWQISTYTPVKEVKGLWRCVITTPDGEFVSYMTTDEEADNFDLIDWKSDDHIPDGLSKYEEIDLPEE